MKLSGILRVAVLALPLVLASCGSKKKTVQPQTTSRGTIEKANFISAEVDAYGQSEDEAR